MENKRRIQHTVFFMLVLFATACIQLHAQHLQIATDYNTCLMGAKNYAGNWVILPQYENLVEDKNGFVAQSGGRIGLISKTGRVLIPIEYDIVADLYDDQNRTSMPDEYYIVRRGDLCGVSDTGNRVIVPMLYTQIEGYFDSTIAARLGRDEWFFYRLSGESFKAPWKTYWAPDMVLPHVYSMRGKLLVLDRHGLTSDSGRVILPKKYSELAGFHLTNTVGVVKRKKYGFCSPAGRMIWPMNLTMENRWGLYQYQYRYPGDIGIGPARSKNKWGLISIDGDTILPFIYDEIGSFGGASIYNRSNLWRVTKDGLSGIYDDREGWKIPMECSAIQTVITYHTYSDSTDVGLMLYNIGAKWGVKTTSGQEILPCVYDEIASYTNSEIVLRNGDSLMSLCLASANNKINLTNAWSSYKTKEERKYTSRLIEYVPDSKRFSVFSGREGVTAYYHPANTHNRAPWAGRSSLTFDKGEYYHFTLPDSIIISCAFYTQPLTQPVFTGPDCRAYHLNNLYQQKFADTTAMLLLVPRNTEHRLSRISDDYFRNPRYGLTNTGDVFTRSGRLLVSGDTVDRSNTGYHGSDGSLYFVLERKSGMYCITDTNGRNVVPFRKGFIGDYSDRYVWRTTHNRFSKYELFDIRTQQRILNRDDYSYSPGPIWDSLTIIENDDHGCCLYNIPQRRYVSTGFNNIYPLRQDGRAFAVKTCTGKIGIVNESGKLLADTIWTAFTPVEELNSYFCEWSYGQEMENMAFFSRYIFSNQNTQQVFNPAMLVMQPMKNETKELWSKTIFVYKTKTMYRYYEDTVAHLNNRPYVLFIVNEKDTAKYLEWHKLCILDTLYASRRTESAEAQMFKSQADEWMLDDMISEEYFRYHLCAYCKKRGALQQVFTWTRPSSWYMDFAEGFVSPQAFSFSVVHDSWYNGQQLGREWHSNVLLFPDGPHSMLLDSLFKPSGDWKNFIINSVLHYVNTEKDVEGDCQNPAGLPVLLKTSWMIQDEGIALYPPGFRQKNSQLVMVLDWKTLDPYLRDDVQERLPISNP